MNDAAPRVAVVPITQPCSHCGGVKALGAFHQDHSRPNGRMSQCKACRRWGVIKTEVRDLPAGHKHCHRCGETKPLGDFNRDRSHTDGRKYACRACTQRQAAERRQKIKASRQAPPLTQSKNTPMRIGNDIAALVMVFSEVHKRPRA